MTTASGGRTPRTYTHPDVLTAGVEQGWAEPETDPTRIDWPARQAAAAIPFQVINGRPVNPREGTAVRYGRNEMGRWGENLMADALVTVTCGPCRYLLMVKRSDGYGWAVPGGAVEPGELEVQAAVRELAEETGLSVALAACLPGEPRYVPDPRASGEAWAVTIPVYAYLGQRATLPAVTGADDAREAAWIPADTYSDLVTSLERDHGGGRIFTAHAGMLQQFLARKPPAASPTAAVTAGAVTQPPRTFSGPRVPSKQAPAHKAGTGAQPPRLHRSPHSLKGGTSIMTPEQASGEQAPQPQGPRGSQTAGSGHAHRLAVLADWIDQRLSDETCDRQAVAETAAAQLREMAALTQAAEQGARRPVTGAQPGRAAAAAMLRAAADLTETRAGVPQPSAAVHFILTAHRCADIAAAVTAIAAAVPGQWQGQISRSASGDWLDLTAASTGKWALDRTEIRVTAPAGAVCAATGTTTVTTWQPVPAIAQFLGGRPVEDAGGDPR